MNGKKIIACVGDSITEGACSTDRSVNSYPAVLGTLLGDGYEVKNFGAGGAGAQCIGEIRWGVGNYPYVNSGLYKAALESSPDYVIVMLGTNDAYSLSPLKPETVENYTASLKKICESFAELPTHPEILLVGSPYRDDIAARTANLIEIVLPEQKKLAKSMGWRFYDMFDDTRCEILYKERPLLIDSVHFTDDGYRYLAEKIYAAFFKN